MWDRVAGVIHGRPGAQRLAVTSGGTIPDRGLLRCVPAGRAGERQAPRRVGELDEEMVYESRVGDVFVLGASSWRIEDITPDRVLVLPAPGQPGKLPFWHGDTPGRPAELGKAIGAKVRELAALPEAKAVASLRAGGLDELAARNLVRYLAEQRQATGHVPDDRTLVRRAVPRRARRLAGGAALPLRRPGARAVGAGHHGPAARALRRVHRTVIKPGGTLFTITDAMYNEPLSFEVVPGSTADIRIIRLHGPITLANLSIFQKELNAGTEKVTIVDFTESEYIDSAGLGALLNYYVSSKRRGRFLLRLVAVNYRVAELLKLTSAHTLIKAYDSIEAAEAATS